MKNSKPKPQLKPKPKPKRKPTDLEIDKLIAKHIGWTGIRDIKIGAGKLTIGFNPKTQKNTSIPRWTEDMNAILRLQTECLRAEGESANAPTYASILETVQHAVHWQPTFWTYINASPRVRAEAFLRTVKKWKWA